MHEIFTNMMQLGAPQYLSGHHSTLHTACIFASFYIYTIGAYTSAFMQTTLYLL